MAAISTVTAAPMRTLAGRCKVGPARRPADLQSDRRQLIRFACTIGVNQSNW